MSALYAIFLSLSLLAVNNIFSAFRPCQIHIPAHQAHKVTTRAVSHRAPKQRGNDHTLIALLEKAKTMLSRTSSQNKLHEIMALLNQADKKNPLVQRLKNQIHAKM